MKYPATNTPLLVILFLITLRIAEGNGTRSGAEKAKQQGEEALILEQSYRDNLANVWEPFDRSRDVPYFWQIPKAGTTNALAYLSTCMDLVKSTRVGSHFSEHTELKVVNFEGHKYMNVDTSTVDGMRRAKELQLEQSHLVDVVTSGFVHEIPKELFSREHRGRMFALFRHPIERLVSIFFYLQTATWEPTYHPDFADLTVEEYVKSQYFEGNWMVRMITNKMNGPVTNSDLKIAKEFLKTKCLVGLQSSMNDSLDRFQRYFGWDLKDTVRNGNILEGEICRERFFHPEKAGGLKMNTNKHPKIEPGSSEYLALLEGSKLDMELYLYAIELYSEQSEIFD
jgi:hypothetical protein